MFTLGLLQLHTLILGLTILTIHVQSVRSLPTNRRPVGSRNKNVETVSNGRILDHGGFPLRRLRRYTYDSANQERNYGEYNRYPGNEDDVEPSFDRPRSRPYNRYSGGSDLSTGEREAARRKVLADEERAKIYIPERMGVPKHVAGFWDDTPDGRATLTEKSIVKAIGKAAPKRFHKIGYGPKKVSTQYDLISKDRGRDGRRRGDEPPPSGLYDPFQEDERYRGEPRDRWYDRARPRDPYADRDSEGPFPPRAPETRQAMTGRNSFMFPFGNYNFGKNDRRNAEERKTHYVHSSKVIPPPPKHHPKEETVDKNSEEKLKASHNTQEEANPETHSQDEGKHIDNKSDLDLPEGSDYVIIKDELLTTTTTPDTTEEPTGKNALDDLIGSDVPMPPKSKDWLRQQELQEFEKKQEEEMRKFEMATAVNKTDIGSDGEGLWAAVSSERGHWSEAQEVREETSLSKKEEANLRRAGNPGSEKEGTNVTIGGETFEVPMPPKSKSWLKEQAIQESNQGMVDNQKQEQTIPQSRPLNIKEAKSDLQNDWLRQQELEWERSQHVENKKSSRSVSHTSEDDNLYRSSHALDENSIGDESALPTPSKSNERSPERKQEKAKTENGERREQLFGDSGVLDNNQEEYKSWLQERDNDSEGNGEEYQEAGKRKFDPPAQEIPSGELDQNVTMGEDVGIDDAITTPKPSTPEMGGPSVKISDMVTIPNAKNTKQNTAKDQEPTKVVEEKASGKTRPEASNPSNDNSALDDKPDNSVGSEGNSDKGSDDGDNHIRRRKRELPAGKTELSVKILRRTRRAALRPKIDRASLEETSGRKDSERTLSGKPGSSLMKRPNKVESVETKGRGYDQPGMAENNDIVVNGERIPMPAKSGNAVFRKMDRDEAIPLKEVHTKKLGVPKKVAGFWEDTPDEDEDGPSQTKILKELGKTNGHMKIKVAKGKAPRKAEHVVPKLFHQSNPFAREDSRVDPKNIPQGKKSSIGSWKVPALAKSKKTFYDEPPKASIFKPNKASFGSPADKEEASPNGLPREAGEEPFVKPVLESKTYLKKTDGFQTLENTWDRTKSKPKYPVPQMKPKLHEEIFQKNVEASVAEISVELPKIVLHNGGPSFDVNIEEKDRRKISSPETILQGREDVPHNKITSEGVLEETENKDTTWRSIFNQQGYKRVEPESRENFKPIEFDNAMKIYRSLESFPTVVCFVLLCILLLIAVVFTKICRRKARSDKNNRPDFETSYSVKDLVRQRWRALPITSTKLKRSHWGTRYKKLREKRTATSPTPGEEVMTHRML